MNLTIIFEDHGQDFLEWDIEVIGDKTFGRVIGCRPFQEWIWKNKVIWMESLKVGSKPRFVDNTCLNYKIIEILEVSE